MIYLAKKKQKPAKSVELKSADTGGTKRRRKTRTKSNKEIVISKGTPGDQFGIYADVAKLKEIYPKKLINFEKGLKQMIASIDYEM